MGEPLSAWFAEENIRMDVCTGKPAKMKEPACWTLAPFCGPNRIDHIVGRFPHVYLSDSIWCYFFRDGKLDEVSYHDGNGEASLGTALNELRVKYGTYFEVQVDRKTGRILRGAEAAPSTGADEDMEDGYVWSMADGVVITAWSTSSGKWPYIVFRSRSAQELFEIKSAPKRADF
jgi:hypothetical protein